MIPPIEWRGQSVHFNKAALKTIKPGFIFCYPYYEFEIDQRPKAFVNYYEFQEDGTWILLETKELTERFGDQHLKHLKNFHLPKANAPKNE